MRVVIEIDLTRVEAETIHALLLAGAGDKNEGLRHELLEIARLTLQASSDGNNELAGEMINGRPVEAEG